MRAIHPALVPWFEKSNAINDKLLAEGFKQTPINAREGTDGAEFGFRILWPRIGQGDAVRCCAAAGFMCMNKASIERLHPASKPPAAELRGGAN